jgi:predicted HicB family RNase H-like nuclease
MPDNKKVVALNLRSFPKELHRQAKAKAALMGIPLKDLIVQAVIEYLKKNK